MKMYSVLMCIKLNRFFALYFFANDLYIKILWHFVKAEAAANAAANDDAGVVQYRFMYICTGELK